MRGRFGWEYKKKRKNLDEAVFAAYGWDPGIADEDLVAKLLELNLKRADSQ